MIYYLLLLHFIGDFLLQNREIAENKSKNFEVMGNHILRIYTVFLFGLWLPFSIPYPNLIGFILSYCLLHFLQDTFIWRSFKWFKMRPTKDNKSPFPSGEYRYWEDSSFYATIGFDQMLHVATLIFLQRMFL